MPDWIPGPVWTRGLHNSSSKNCWPEKSLGEKPPGILRVGVLFPIRSEKSGSRAVNAHLGGHRKTLALLIVFGKDRDKKAKERAGERRVSIAWSLV